MCVCMWVCLCELEAVGSPELELPAAVSDLTFWKPNVGPLRVIRNS